MNKYAVSVIVAVCNNEKNLDRCIDSLVFQTLENIEIILVDDFSVDSSWQIMKQWQQRFPEKIKVMKSDCKGKTYAKRTGITAANGKYIAIVNPNDFIDYRMFDKLFAYAEKNQYPQMVYSPIWEVNGKKKRKIGAVNEKDGIEAYLHTGICSFAGKLIRRDVFDKYDMLITEGTGEDLVWMFCLLTHKPDIVYCPSAAYYCDKEFKDKTFDGELLDYIEKVKQDVDVLVRNCNREYKEEAFLFAVNRIIGLCNDNPLYRDMIHENAVKYIDDLCVIDDLQEKASILWEFVRKYTDGINKIPQVVYVNGFANENKCDFSKFKNVFREEPQIVILNENNCDVQSSPIVVQEAYADKNYDFVGKYFAVKACYEYGGVYVDYNIEIEAPFNMLTTDPAFFGYETDETFTDKVFGCLAGNQVFEKILKTYQYSNMYADRFESLAGRIKTILVGIGNIELKSETRSMWNYGFCVYPVEMFVFSLPFIDSVSVSHYKNQETLASDIRVKQDILETVCSRWLELSGNDDEMMELNKALKWNREQVGVMKGQLEWNRGQVETFKSQLEWNRGQVETFKSQLEWNRGQVETFKNQLEWNRGQVETFKNQLEWNREQVKVLKEQLEWNREKKEEKKRENDILKKDIALIRKEKNDIEAELKKYKASTLVRIAWKAHSFLKRISEKMFGRK